MPKTRNSKIGEIKTEEVIDARIMRKLDESTSSIGPTRRRV
jgi:hypothetical protein